MKGVFIRKGFSLIEIIIAVTIVSALAGISMVSFISFTRNEALSAGASALAAGLRDARAQTLASVGDSQFGVKIETNGFTLFNGAIFSPTATTNRQFIFGSSVKASSSHDQFIFQRLTGDSVSAGTVELYLSSKPTDKKIVRIERTGIVNIE